MPATPTPKPPPASDAQGPSNPTHAPGAAHTACAPAAPAAPSAADRSALDALRERLHRLGFDRDRVGEALGTADEADTRRAGLAAQLRRLDDFGPLGDLVRLFVLAQPVAADRLGQAMAPLPLAALADTGLVQVADGRVQPQALLQPYESILLASDLPLVAGAPHPLDHVPGVQNPSVTLAHLTVRREVDAFLDLGTGCGVEALLAAGHARQIVATDVSPRAAAFAAFNAALNGADAMTVRTGSWFEPVQGERFDTLVCCPPYVISPASDFVFRDGGQPRDGVCEQLVRAVPEHLNDGGYASLQISWVAGPAGDVGAPVRSWTSGSGCDAWLLHLGTDTPLQSATRWNRDLAQDPTRHAARLDHWLRWYREQGIAAIAYGTLILRRRPAGTAAQPSNVPIQWHCDSLDDARIAPASGHIQRVFDARLRLAGMADEALLGQKLAVAPGAVVSQDLRFHDGRPKVRGMTLRIEEGIGFEAGLDPATMFLLTQLGASPTLGHALAQAAQRAGADDASGYARAHLPMLRRMLELGFLSAHPG